MQIAAWRALPPRPIGFGARMRQVRWDAWLIGLAFVAAFLGVGLALSYFTHTFGGNSYLFIYACTPAVYALRKRIASRRLATLLTVPSPINEYPVQLLLTRGGSRYAVDYGVLTFVDECLVYNGFSTSFSLSPMWAPPVQAAKGHKWGTLPKAGEYTLMWRARNVPFSATFIPQVGIPGANPHFEKQLRDDFKSWQNRSRVAFPSQDVIPPMDGQPEFLIGVRRRAVLTQWFGVLATIGVAVLYSKMTTPDAALCWLIAVFIWITVITNSALYRRRIGEQIPAIDGSDIRLNPVLKATWFALHPTRWWVSPRTPLPPGA